MNTSTLFLYLATWSLVAVTPGPAVLCVMSHATRGGVRASLASIAGLQLGNLLFFIAVGTGLAALLATFTTAFTVLRFAGAAYLAWLGIRVIMSTFGKQKAPAASPSRPAAPHGRVFLQGLFIQLTNPKALLFASALLPQFLNPNSAMFPQLAVLFAVTLVVDVASMLSYALLAARGGRSVRASVASVWLERVFGTALVAFGARIALSAM